MKKILLLITLAFGMLFTSQAQNSGDFSGSIQLNKTMTNAETDSVLVNISGSRSAITFKYDITKVSGTVAGTITLQYKVTNLGSEKWFTYNTYTLTDASAIVTVPLNYNPAIKWKIITATTGTSVSTHNKYLVYRK